MQRIKKGDIVQVISGNERGARGQVKEMKVGWTVNSRQQKKTRDHNKDRVVIEKINIRKKHQKRTGPTQQAGIIDLEAPVHISNVMLVCPTCDEASRIRFDYQGDKKVRVCVQCQATIDN